MFDLMPFDKRQDKNNGLMERYFNFPHSSFFNDFMDMKGVNFKTDIKEKEDSYILEAELPGLEKENIIIETEKDYLTIKVNKEENFEEEKDNFLHRERRTGSYQRSFRFNNVDIENIKAEYNNGILEINLPKLEKEKPRRKRIDIN
ncbi:hypothetical protein U472_11235 [Orenia metallireducens]|uniref:SHSP domain-containing protein n=1 Tax=Orenia metallireducens TaxID=1413210 RepID=A0A1C0A8I1_9FIRM|nr:Hsp20/alpha crystallin family protein [Orenia metallireducens]OCL26556.1 hypothetical protein U472_11235 [Orenia metallireducens]